MDPPMANTDNLHPFRFYSHGAQDSDIYDELSRRLGLEITPITSEEMARISAQKLETGFVCVPLALYSDLFALQRQFFIQERKLSQEVNDRTRLEEVIERAKREWEAIVDTILEMVILTDLDGVITRCNRETASNFQTSYHELIGTDIKAWFGEEVAAVRGYRAGQEHELEIPSRQQWLSVSCYPFILKGLKHGFVYIIQDITLRKKTEIELERSEKRNATILNAIPDSIFRLTAGGEIVDIQEGVSDIWFEPSVSIIGRNFSEYLPPKLWGETEKLIGNALASGEHQVIEYPINLGNRDYFFDGRIIPIGSDEVLVILRDISERAQLEQMKSDFINRASHELRSPLTSALLAVRLIQQGGTDEETREYWRILQSELDRQRVLVERLLTVGRLETGNLKLVLQEVDVSKVLGEAISAVLPFSQESQIEIKYMDSKKHLMVIADSHALLQVFINLLNNAIKYSYPKGEVEVSVQDGEGEIFILFEDHGFGIPEDELPRLFTRFFRGQTAIRNEIPGTGIGLFIVKSILTEMRGSISVDSREGQGSRFRVRLPTPSEI
jgi:two-component system phosphate regulon sensor histidine kinase PhoR